MFLAQPAVAARLNSGSFDGPAPSLARMANQLAVPTDAVDDPRAAVLPARRTDAGVALAASYEDFAHSGDAPAQVLGPVISALGYAAVTVGDLPDASRVSLASATASLDVREPATWMMMIAGIGLIGVAMRWKRRDRTPRVRKGTRAALRTGGSLGGRATRHVAAGG
ncbi:PEPxxWA-CTERM sorting domain-containing protein [Sphingomonas sp.]|uniref:PEPxxWA-CTERM sorting domain-containing protein n=1 Tax=Sphingomonas sp. TaxID=28214 RepID=UPI0025DAB80F|nr:PEPxxWA-CTERM sorting domain-containing protein [Sphingomonas sp.]